MESPCPSRPLPQQTPPGASAAFPASGVSARRGPASQTQVAPPLLRALGRGGRWRTDPPQRPVESGQYLSIRYTERLAEAGIEPSVGSCGDSYANALAESVIGLYKTEVIRHDGPWRGLEGVELATLEWVWWFIERRLLEPLGYLPPVEYEDAFYRRREAPATEAALT